MGWRSITPLTPLKPHPLSALTPPPLTSLPAAVIRSVNRQDECVQPSLHQNDILIVWINELTVGFRANVRVFHLTLVLTVTFRFPIIVTHTHNFFNAYLHLFYRLQFMDTVSVSHIAHHKIKKLLPYFRGSYLITFKKQGKI